MENRSENFPPPAPQRSVEKQEQREQFPDLTIVTTTFYRDIERNATAGVRSKLALELFENAQRLGIRCVVSDGGSDVNFIDQVRGFDNVILTVDDGLGMGESRRKALADAIKSVPGEIKNPQFLWVEPEKSGLITEDSLEKMITSLREGKTDIVVPTRTENAFRSLPGFQAWIEKRANSRVEQKVVEDKLKRCGLLDLWFGPKMFNQEGARYFLEYKGELDKWDSIIKPVVDAYQHGASVESVTVDYIYDSSQKEQEEGDEDIFNAKRVEQYTNILAELGDPFHKRKREEARAKDGL